MKHLQNIKGEMDRVNLEIQNAERDYDLNHAAELKYGTLIQLQKQLQEAETALEAQVRLLRSCLKLQCPEQPAELECMAPSSSCRSSCARRRPSSRRRS